MRLASSKSPGKGTVCTVHTYSETTLIQHSMGLERSVGLGGCRITEWPLAYFSIVTVPHKMAGLERMSDYRDFTVRTWR